MKTKISTVILILSILIFSLGLVSAHDVNDSDSSLALIGESNQCLADCSIAHGCDSLNCKQTNGGSFESVSCNQQDSFKTNDDKKLNSNAVSEGNVIKPSNNTFKGIRKAINQSNANDTILLDGNYDYDFYGEDDDNEICISKDLVFEGNDGSIGDEYGYFISVNDSSVVFNNMTFNVCYSSFIETIGGDLTFNDCTFNSGYFYLSGDSFRFNRCIFATRLEVSSDYSSFENCSFDEEGSHFRISSDHIDIRDSTFEHDEEYKRNYIISNSSNISYSSFDDCVLLSKSFINVPLHVGLGSGSIEINTLGNESADIEISGDVSYEGTVQGRAFIPLDNLKKGYHNITVSYMSDSSYIENSYNFSVVDGSLDDVILDFPKQINSAEYDVSDEPYGLCDYEFHLYNLPSYFQGNIKYLLDGREVNVIDEGKGKYFINFGPYYNRFQDAGLHEFTVYYEGDEYFGDLNLSAEVLTAPITFNISSDKIVFNHIYDAKGNLLVKVNGKLYKNLTISDSPYPYPVYRVSDGWQYYENYGHFILYNTTIVNLDLNDGDEVEAVYEGNYGKYITVDTISSDGKGPYYYIIINNTDCVYGEGYLSGKNYTQILLPDIDDINVTVSIDGKESVFHDRCINISNLSFGNHNVSVDYSGDVCYPSKSFDFNINVLGKAIINWNVDEDGLVVFDAGDKAKISLTLPADANGNFTVYYKNGSKYKVYKTVELKDGKASIAIKGIAGYVNPSKTVGVNYFKTKFLGNYKVAQEVYKVIFVPETYEKNGYFNFVSGENGKLKIKVSQYFYDDQNCEVKNRSFTLGTYNVKNGAWKIALSKLPLGIINLDYTFTSASGNKISGWGYVERPTKLALKAKAVTMLYGDGTKYSVQLIENLSFVEKGSVVKIKIKSKTYKVKVGDKGIAKLSIDLLPGKYTVTASYKNKSVKTNLVVKQSLTLNKATVRKYAKKLVLTASLKKVNGKYLKGKKIVFKFNGKKYTAKTNSKGVAKVTISKSTLKKLKIGKKLTYTATYIKTTVKRTVKVKR